MNERGTMLVLYLILFLAAWFVVCGFIWAITGIVKDAREPGHKADAVLDEMEREEQLLQGADNYEKENEGEAEASNL